MPTPCEEKCYQNWLAECNAAWAQFWLDHAACNGDTQCILTAKAARDARFKKAELTADLCIENCANP